MGKSETSDSKMAKKMEETDQQIRLNEFSNKVFESTVEAAKDFSVIYRQNNKPKKPATPDFKR